MRAHIADVAAVANLIGIPPHARRGLQEIPDYTSPPTEAALSATPAAWRSDASVDAARAAAAAGNCTAGEQVGRRSCQILFPPPAAAVESEAGAKLGVVLYGGALVDPRSFSPLASTLSGRYGLAVSVPVFDRDLAFSFGSCDTGRIPLAAEAFPDVERWVLAGHSFGGLAAQTDLWTLMGTNDADGIAGLVLLASYVRQDIGCGAVDFSGTDVAAASVSGSLDGVVNATNWEAGRAFLPENDTFWLDVLGGNHAQFGSYDDSGRKTILGQNDGVPAIPEVVQRDLSAAAIAHVASRAGLPLPLGSSAMQPTEDPASPPTDEPPTAPTPSTDELPTAPTPPTAPTAPTAELPTDAEDPASPPTDEPPTAPTPSTDEPPTAPMPSTDEPPTAPMPSTDEPPTDASPPTDEPPIDASPPTAPTGEAPTSPTEQPTVAPTQEPPAPPTEGPSSASTEAPTLSPTQGPTSSPGTRVLTKRASLGFSTTTIFNIIHHLLLVI